MARGADSADQHHCGQQEHRLWDWHVRTGRMPYFRKNGFWKGAGLGSVVGLSAVIAATWLGLKDAEHPAYGDLATAAFYGAWLYGVFLIGALTVVFGCSRSSACPCWTRTRSHMSMDQLIVTPLEARSSV